MPRRSKPAKPKRRARKPKRARGAPGPARRRVSVARLVALLRKTPAGKGLTKASIQEDIEAGMKVNRDGTIDLVEYMAWLLKRHGYKED